MTPTRSSVREERGAALLETAVTLPLLLLVAVGIFEFGRAFQTWQVLTNAAREGARVAVLPGTDDEAVRARVQTYLEAGALSSPESADVTINRTSEVSIGSDTASASTVAVSYPFEFMVLQPIARLIVRDSTSGEPIAIGASATMRNE